MSGQESPLFAEKEVAAVTMEELVHIDPRTLAVSEVRGVANGNGNGKSGRGKKAAEPAVDADFDELVTSVRRLGVLQPVLVVPDGAGYRLVAGRRRVAAAVVAELETVPAYVRPDLAPATGGLGGLDIAAELVENVRRRDLTPIERAKAFEQLAAFDLDDLTIAELTGESTESVVRHLRVVRSKPAAAIAEKVTSLTIEQAAALAEFEDDAEAMKELERTARDRPEDIEHRVAWLRRDRETAARYEATLEELKASGVSVLKPAGGYNGYRPDSTKAVRLGELADEKGKGLTVAGHRKCQGHAAFLGDRSHFHGDRKPEYYCADPAKFGHTRRARASYGPEKTEKEKADESAERRRVIANNKAWRAATDVRLAFVHNLCGSTPAQLAKSKTAFPYAVAEAVLRGSVLDQVRDKHLVDFTGLKVEKPAETGQYDEDGRYVTCPASKPLAEGSLVERQAGLLRMVLAARELMLVGRTWRSAGAEDCRYLHFLVAEGYTLSEIEAQTIEAVAAKTASAAKSRAHRERPATRAERQDAINRQVEAAAAERNPGGVDDPGEDACRVCGCTEDAPCAGGCSWAPLAGDELDTPAICTRCVDKITAGEAVDPLGAFQRCCTACERSVDELAAGGIVIEENGRCGECGEADE